MDHIQALFDAIWQDYTQRLCPSAVKIHKLLGEGTPLLNDHIALRTFASSKIGLHRLAAPFITLGYEQKGKYVFKNKKLLAHHYEHPNLEVPKVFISELMVDQCSLSLQATVRRLIEQVEDNTVNTQSFIYSGRQWDLDFETYRTLMAESEYAGWLAAHGFGANHFTVSINQLFTINDVQQINVLLRQSGFVINESGGEIKGSPEVYLEQSSIMADKVSVRFSDREAVISAGFYEFAKRYILTDGTLYQGFVEASADKIFESTNK